ncbi:glycoside hydrolase family 3 protein [Oceanidesulfovibrio marinus]|nr:glycoside hydrolase family 3 protein [Oceanidesulfovibrio marinus]
MATISRMAAALLAAACVMFCAAGAFAADRAKAGAGTAMQADEPTLEAMLGQMVMVGFRGLMADPESAIGQDIRAGRVGGVILFDYDVALKSRTRNIDNPAQVLALTRGLQAMTPDTLLVAVDQEGGRVMRLKPRYGFPDSPSAELLGEAGDPEATRGVASAMGQTLATAGFNLDFAPVVDVNVNPANPVIGGLGRSFSGDSEVVAQQAGAFVQGLHEHGVLSCLKHFPGHGSSTGDTHVGLTDVTRTWTEAELIPYRRLIAAGLVDMIMTAHIVNRKLDARLPASLSEKVITGLLRGELGFDGVVVSDDLQMGAIAKEYSPEKAAVLAIHAGADIVLFGNNLNYDPGVARRVVAHLVKEVRAGRIDAQRIRRSYERIRRLKDSIAR